jgi:cytochrome P450
MDPPVHDEYRRFLNRLVVLASRHAGKPLVRSVVNEVIEASHLIGAQDMTRGFAIPVVARTLFRYIGFPGEDEEEFLSHAQSFIRSHHAVHVGPRSGDAQSSDPFQVRLPDQDQAWTEYRWMRDYIRLQVRRVQPSGKNGLLGLLKATDWKTHFDTHEAEAATILMEFVQAGLMNTSLALRKGLEHLVANHNDREALLEHRSLAPCMTDELLRIYPLSTPARTVRRDVEWAGVKLHVGEIVLPLLDMANHDATVFEQPGRVILGRRNRSLHLAFGAGPHYCLGASLARSILAASFASIDRIIRHYEQ